VKRRRKDDVALFMDKADAVSAMVDMYAKPSEQERQAADGITALLPTLRVWADSLDKRDRLGLAMALHIATHAEYLNGAAANLHADATIGRSVAHRGPRESVGTKSRQIRVASRHAAIVKEGQRLRKAGEKTHKIASNIYAQIKGRMTHRQLRTILQRNDVVPRRKGK
jgi:hypothetical protein